MKNLRERTALVTGGSRGIGAAICLRLAQEGLAVAVNYRERRGEAEDVAEAINSAGGRAMAVQADVADVAAVKEMVRSVASELGHVDILVNNAGIMCSGDLDRFDANSLETMRRTNVDGMIHATQAVADGMKARNWGRIVNLSSIAAHGTSMAGTTFYAATKAEVVILTRRFALDLGPFGITVNAVAPGYIVTDMVYAGRSREDAEEFLKVMASKAMVHRTGRPEDIAGAVAYLVSEDAGFMTAQVMTVDGGRTDYIVHP